MMRRTACAWAWWLLFGCSGISGLSGCLREIAAEAGDACNSKNRCVPGLVCVEGTCRAEEEVECRPEAEQPCPPVLALPAPCTSGQRRCTPQATWGPCVGRVEPAVDDRSCNGIDDDCDGATDEEYPVRETRCGTGACAAVGQLECAAGLEVDRCTPGQPAAGDATCDALDDDCDGTTDEACDRDGDRIVDPEDNCPEAANGDQRDLDGDRLGDGCDLDRDGDQVPDDRDNCREEVNPDQADLDGDRFGNLCDPDRDGDQVVNAADNCPDLYNDDQHDLDGDQLGCGCDPDSDGDGVDNELDNCPEVANPGQDDRDEDQQGDVCDDSDGDRVPDATDRCPELPDPDQADLDGDRLGDRCDPDRDGDQVLDDQDNCPELTNPGQGDLDGDRQGDPCDPDRDGDGVLDGPDNCPEVFNPDQRDPGAGDSSCNGIDDDCDGVTDEEYPVAEIGCGLGRCHAVGQRVCEHGQEVSRCTPGEPAPREECNELDDDCDGFTDELLDCAATCRSGHLYPEAPLREPPAEPPPELRPEDRWVLVCPGTFVMGSPGPECEPGCTCGTEDGQCQDPRCQDSSCPGRDPGRLDATIDPRYPRYEGQHRVTLTIPLLMQATEVTQEQWSRMQWNPAEPERPLDGAPVANPSFFVQDGQGREIGQRRPVERVNQFEAAAYCNWLSARHGLPLCYEFLLCDESVPQAICTVPEAGLADCGRPGEGFMNWRRLEDGSQEGCRGAVRAKLIYPKPQDCPGFRLPTEAEWEYAARAGVVTAFPDGPSRHGRERLCQEEPFLNDWAWYCWTVRDMSVNGTQLVATQRPNAWGLHDMLGNV